jgi:hybrid cluster-associated redox disulfide protein
MPCSEAAAEQITADTNVDQLIDRFPATAGVFIKHRMSCVGCDIAKFETLAEACAIYRKPLEPLLADLRQAAIDS